MEEASTTNGSQTLASSPSTREKTHRKLKYRGVDIQEDVEYLEDYEPGGLCPINIGDELHDGRFRVFHKLGHGGIATVWLCRDGSARTWRAVKINAADHSSEDGPDMRAAHALGGPGVSSSRVAAPLETFWMDSPNGKHLCSVLPVLGPRLCDWRAEMGSDAVRANKVCSQLVEGLGFLHGRGVCHGDFRPQNVLMRLRPGCLDGIDEESMASRLGGLDTAEVRTVGGEKSYNAPGEVVAAVLWQLFGEFVTDDIAIVDFGESFPISSPPKTLGIPRKYAAPEVTFGGVPGPGSDIWSLAMSLIETRLGTSLDEDVRSILWRMERLAGPVPLPYRRAAAAMLSKARGKPVPGEDETESGGELAPVTAPLTGFAKAERRQAQTTGFDDPLEILLGDEYTATEYVADEDDPDGGLRPEIVFVALGKEEVVAFAGPLRKMLRHDPGQRAGADEILEDGWFVKRPPAAAKKDNSKKTEEDEKPEQPKPDIAPVVEEKPREAEQEKEKKGKTVSGFNIITCLLIPVLAALLTWGIVTMAFRGSPAIDNVLAGSQVGAWKGDETQIIVIEVI